MTAVILPFPVMQQPSEYESWKIRVTEKHPEWDAAHVEMVAHLCMSIDRGVKRRQANGGDHG